MQSRSLLSKIAVTILSVLTAAGCASFSVDGVEKRMTSAALVPIHPGDLVKLTNYAHSSNARGNTPVALASSWDAATNVFLSCIESGPHANKNKAVVTSDSAGTNCSSLFVGGSKLIAVEARVFNTSVDGGKSDENRVADLEVGKSAVTKLYKPGESSPTDNEAERLNRESRSRLEGNLK